MTMKELAKLCNVSVSAVSKAFHDADDISADTKEHIFETAKQNGCFGKYYKGKYNKKIIAVIVPELRSYYYSESLERLKKFIEERDAMCVISVDDFSGTKQAELIEYYASYLKVDGILVLGIKCQLKKGYETPIVAVMGKKDTNADMVDINFYPAMEKAAARLFECGHRDIAFIGENLTNAKKEAFLSAANNFNFNSVSVYDSSLRFEEAGVDGVKYFEERSTPYTALICAYDNIAFGAIKQLKAQGKAVPKDVSVIGMDNISVDNFTETSLSSIEIFSNAVCVAALDLLEKKMKNKYYRHKEKIIIEAEFIERESIANIK